MKDTPVAVIEDYPMTITYTDCTPVEDALRFVKQIRRRREMYGSYKKAILEMLWSNKGEYEDKWIYLDDCIFDTIIRALEEKVEKERTESTPANQDSL